MADTPRRSRVTDDASHADIIAALNAGLAKLTGTVEANFTTLFRRMDRVESDVDGLNERCARIEERLSIVPSGARPKGWMWIPIIAACIALMGGLSAAYGQAARIAVAVHQAITGSGS